MTNEPRYHWYRSLNRYHWFVLAVCGLGWLFDTMDQQLFNLARVPAMRELLAPSPGALPPVGAVEKWGPIATSIFLIGWAFGGLVFGVLGDRIGRAKTMLLTILVYSLFTGLSAISVGFWDFAVYRFLTGLGVGGEFAVGVALMAEVMPSRARPYALGLLQALSTVGNIIAALISIGLGRLEETGVMGNWTLPFLDIKITAWRAMFLVGTLPALLAIVIRRKLKEPERWQEVAEHTGDPKRLGSYSELFGDPRGRKRAIVGLLLSAPGVVGLWGIGFFSIDLNRSVLRKVFEQELRDEGKAAWDRDFVRLVLANENSLNTWAKNVRPIDLINSTSQQADAQLFLTEALALAKDKQAVTREAVLLQIDKHEQTPEQRAHRADYLSGEPAMKDGESLVGSIAARSAALSGRLTLWAGYTSIMLNFGGFIGMYGFGIVSERIGRRPTFFLAFIAAALSTILVFARLNDVTDVWWMLPLMGIGIFSLFGGYAIYLPELFPTRLRSTGTSFCYNVGRVLAAAGPLSLGYLASKVFGGYDEPLRMAGITMCGVFMIGLLTLPFAPETKGQPLPE